MIKARLSEKLLNQFITKFDQTIESRRSKMYSYHWWVAFDKFVEESLGAENATCVDRSIQVKDEQTLILLKLKYDGLE